MSEAGWAERKVARIQSETQRAEYAEGRVRALLLELDKKDAALRRAKAEGRIKSMWEAVHIANTYNCDHNHGKKATEAVDNVLLKLYDRIAELEADARAAQIEEGE